MQDEILKGYLRDFSDQNGLETRTEPEQFERFVNYWIISKQYPRDFDFEGLSVGGGADSALDGVAIIVNGDIVQEPEEIDFFLTRNGSLSVSFSFVQSKTSSKFSGAQILNFLAGIKNFFSEKSSIPENEEVNRLRTIKQNIYAGQRTVAIKSFGQRRLDAANEEYAAAELIALESPDTKQAVLVTTSSVEALRRAYPNYFLDTRQFLSALARIERLSAGSAVA
jgi:hypothetical protein